MRISKTPFGDRCGRNDINLEAISIARCGVSIQIVTALINRSGLLVALVFVIGISEYPTHRDPSMPRWTR